MEAILTSENLILLAMVAAVFPLGASLRMFLSRSANGLLPVICSAFSFQLSALIFFQVWNQQEIHEQFTWFTIGETTFSAGILLNNLTVLMMLLVSSISLLVQIYSTAYMKNDPGLNRYWGYLGLFCFSMMGLVVADNLLVIYGFWELVGFSSYLLIGFWFRREAAIQANKKAFIINRIGDLGFLAAIAILYAQFQTLDISRLFGNHGLLEQAVLYNDLWISATSQMPAMWLTVAGLTLFLGAMAKSAQFPFHTWLPDAMEGPTSVSALIHAATMVAAGVFLLVRVFPLFDETVLLMITCVGVLTAFMAATIAIMQNDLKKILAYSTISQLGFMMLAVGIGTYGNAMFHLGTHAFFKCLLFLGAGAIIHEMQRLKERSGLDFDPQDIRNMGALRDFMPITFLTMLIASLALIGFPLTSGYLSKDAILVDAFKWGFRQGCMNVIIPYLALLSSLLTTFYIGRLLFRVFFGRFKVEGLPENSTLHEAPLAMRIPLIILAVFCLYPLFSPDMWSSRYAWISDGLQAHIPEHVDILSFVIPIIVNFFGAIILLFAWFKYGRKASTGFEANGGLSQFAFNGWYINQVQEILLVKPMLFISRASYGIDRSIIDGAVHFISNTGLLLSRISSWIDEYIIDAFVNFLGTFSKSIGNFTRRFQTGRVQSYLFSMMAVMLLFFIIKFLIRLL